MVWFSVVVQVRATPGGVVQCGGAGEGYTGRCGSVWWCRRGLHRVVWFSVVVRVRATPGGVVQCGGAGEGYTGWCGSVWWCR